MTDWLPSVSLVCLWVAISIGTAPTAGAQAEASVGAMERIEPRGVKALELSAERVRLPYVGPFVGHVCITGSGPGAGHPFDPWLAPHPGAWQYAPPPRSVAWDVYRKQRAREVEPVQSTE